MTLLVGLLGFAGVGKDTTAAALGYPTYSFAADLKAVCQPVCNALGLDVTNREDKEVVRPVLVETGRAGRRIRDTFWIERLARTTHLWANSVATITDVRYLNECLWVAAMGGVVFHLRRPNIGPANDEEADSFAEIGLYQSRTGHRITNIEAASPEEAADMIRRHLKSLADRWLYLAGQIG